MSVKTLDNGRGYKVDNGGKDELGFVNKKVL